MQGWQLFASPPFWAIFIGTLLVALLAVEGGYTWARYRRQHSTTEREREKEAAVLIVDLDRTGDGWIIVPQDALTDVRNELIVETLKVPNANRVRTHGA